MQVGVPPGPASPDQNEARSLGYPLSAVVGTSSSSDSAWVRFRQRPHSSAFDVRQQNGSGLEDHRTWPPPGQ